MDKQNLKHLSKYFTKHIALLGVVLLSLLIVAGSLLIFGAIFRNLIDSGVANSDASKINDSIIAICSIIIIFAVGSFCRSYFINLTALKVVSNIKSDTYKNLLTINLTKFETLKIGDIMSRLGADIDLVKSLIINFLSFFVRNFIMLIGGLILMFIQSPKLAIMVIFGVPTMLFPLLILSKKVRSLSKQTLDSAAQMASCVEETFSGIQTLYAYNRQEYSAKLFEEKTEKYIELAGKRLKLRSLFFALVISLISIFITLVIWIGSLDVINGNMSSGRIFSFIYYALMVGMSSGGLAELFSEIQSPLAALERIFQLKNTKIEKFKETNEALTLSKKYKITFKGVCFAYPSRPDIEILKDMSFEFNSGKFIAFVGESGAGKSTIMQLLVKFFEANSGKVIINNQNVQKIGSHSLRQKIAYIQQQPTIFSGTIKSNIAFANPSTPDDKITGIANICGINEFADKLPHGLDTEIGEKGVRLSGGQQQRIAIARALLYSPEILLLDEATSAIDSKGEAKLLKNIQRLIKGKTIISIAHRISSIQDADEIFIVSKGGIISSGKHNQLIRNSTMYNKLHNKFG